MRATWGGIGEAPFNNVIYDPKDGGNYIAGSVYLGNATGGTYKIFNNTVKTGADDGSQNYAGMGSSSALDSCLWKNNHYITAYDQIANLTVNYSQSNNLFQTKAKAKAQGYSGSSTYPFYPSRGGATIGTGINLTNLIPRIVMPGLSSPTRVTTVGVGYNTSNHTVIVPARAASGRPSSGAWDIVAYQYVPEKHRKVSGKKK